MQPTTNPQPTSVTAKAVLANLANFCEKYGYSTEYNAGNNTVSLIPNGFLFLPLYHLHELPTFPKWTNWVETRDVPVGYSTHLSLPVVVYCCAAVPF